MAYWITVYCRVMVAPATPQQLLDGIQGGDQSALAGVDYATLAEDYGLAEADAARAQSALNVEALESNCNYQVTYGAAEQPLIVRLWRDPTRLEQEIAEITERAGKHPVEAVQWVRSSTAVVAIELTMSQIRDMGIVIAYEIARYVAQRFEGLILTDDERWLRVMNGMFQAIWTDW
jgi:hypothetical protein